METSIVVDVRVPAAVESARDVRRVIGGFCERHDVDRARTADVALAVSEAVTNAVIHAYPDGGGDIDVYGEVRDGDLVVVVRDYGVGVPPDPDSPRCGAGVEIMTGIADCCELHPAHPGLCVRLRFRLRG